MVRSQADYQPRRPRRRGFDVVKGCVDDNPLKRVAEAAAALQGLTGEGGENIYFEST